MTIAVRMRHVGVVFNGHAAVRDISLELPGPGVSVLVGRSGSGKTSLLRTLNRLNEEFSGCVSSGDIELDLGQGLEPVQPRCARSLPELRRRVGMLFQTPNVFPVSVFRNLSIPLEFALGCPKAEIPERARAVLVAVHLWDEVQDRLDLPAERLSGGQKQRLCLARVLALEPSLLLLDEPTASLDVHAAGEVEELISGLARSYPVVMVSHSLAQARRLADRLLVLEGGLVTRCFEREELPGEEALASFLCEKAQMENPLI